MGSFKVLVILSALGIGLILPDLSAQSRGGRSGSSSSSRSVSGSRSVGPSRSTGLSSGSMSRSGSRISRPGISGTGSGIRMPSSGSYSRSGAGIRSGGSLSRSRSLSALPRPGISTRSFSTSRRPVSIMDTRSLDRRLEAGLRSRPPSASQRSEMPFRSLPPTGNGSVDTATSLLTSIFQFAVDSRSNRTRNAEASRRYYSTASSPSRSSVPRSMRTDRPTFEYRSRLRDAERDGSRFVAPDRRAAERNADPDLLRYDSRNRSAPDSITGPDTRRPGSRDRREFQRSLDAAPELDPAEPPGSGNGDDGEGFDGDDQGSEGDGDDGDDDEDDDEDDDCDDWWYYWCGCYKPWWDYWGYGYGYGYPGYGYYYPYYYDCYPYYPDYGYGNAYPYYEAYPDEYNRSRATYHSGGDAEQEGSGEDLSEDLLDAEAFLDRGVNLFKKGNYIDALSYFRRAVLTDLNSAPAKFLYAFGLFSLGLYDHAAEEIHRGLALMPEWPEWGGDLRKMYPDARDFDEQRSALVAHLKVWPQDENARLVLAYTAHFTGDRDLGEKIFEDLAGSEDEPTAASARTFLIGIKKMKALERNDLAPQPEEGQVPQPDEGQAPQPQEGEVRVGPKDR